MRGKSKEGELALLEWAFCALIETTRRGSLRLADTQSIASFKITESAIIGAPYLSKTLAGTAQPWAAPQAGNA